MGLLELLQENPWSLILALAATYVVHQLYVFNRLRQFKGPFSSGFSNFLHTKAFLSLECEQWYEEVSEKYGPIARIAPNGLITSSPDLWIHLNAARSPYKRSDWYYHGARFKAGEDSVFSTTDSGVHDRKRKQMFSAYAGKENPSLESDIDTRIQDFLDLIRKKYLSSKSSYVEMDLGQKIQFLTLDVISTVGLGTPFGMLRADRDINDYLKSMTEGLFISNIMVGTGVYWIMQKPWVGKLLGAPTESDPRGFGKMMATAAQMIDERLKSPTDAKSDMLAAFIRNGLAGPELKVEAFEQVLAGSDTTASSLQGIMLCLLSNPRVYRKLQAEIDDAVKSGKAPANGIISDAQAKQLDYLQAVIREGIRIIIPVANVFARDVPPGGDTATVDGKQVYLPGGTWVGYSALAMHRSKEVFGEDAKVFRPERWLLEQGDTLANMKRVNDLIFGHGRWKCLGQTVAKIELSKTIFEALRHFDFGLVNPQKPWSKINIMGLFSVSNMMVTVTARS